MIRGLVIGKFYPPHLGHQYLIESGLKQVDQLDVLVCVRPGQDLAGPLRAAWLREMCPSAQVREVADICDDDNSQRWADYTRGILGYAPDVVFTSESYGDAYARFLGARHVCVDSERSHFPISARKVRVAPLDHLDFLPPCVRAHYVKRICIVGAESTGTTTLAQDLATHYATICVPEYGREYSERKLHQAGAMERIQWTSEEFVRIAETQCRLEDQAARRANRVLLCDTDALATTIWHERYVGGRNDAVDAIARARHYDLYVLTGPDIPFVQDGMRDGEHIRQWMTDRFREELTSRNLPWMPVSGTRKQRLHNAIRVIDRLLEPR